MRARRTKPREIDGFTSLQPAANEFDAVGRVVGADLMEAGRSQQFCGEPPRGAKAGGAEAGVFGTNSLIGHIEMGLSKNSGRFSINHNWRRATTPVPRDRDRPLDRKRPACDNCVKAEALREKAMPQRASR